MMYGTYAVWKYENKLSWDWTFLQLRERGSGYFPPSSRYLDVLCRFVFIVKILFKNMQVVSKFSRSCEFTENKHSQFRHRQDLHLIWFTSNANFGCVEILLRLEEEFRQINEVRSWEPVFGMELFSRMLYYYWGSHWSPVSFSGNLAMCLHCCRYFILRFLK